MTLSKDEIVKELKKENDVRWFGRPIYDCLSCSHSMSTENNELICVENENNHKKVEEEHVCIKWI